MNEEGNQASPSDSKNQGGIQACMFVVSRGHPSMHVRCIPVRDSLLPFAGDCRKRNVSALTMLRLLKAAAARLYWGEVMMRSRAEPEGGGGEWPPGCTGGWS